LDSLEQTRASPGSHSEDGTFGADVVGDEVRVTEDGGWVVDTGPEEDDDIEDDVMNVVVTTASKADAAENKNSQTSIS
jgi:hypothetical protein